jgi:hypothetical protein
MTSQATSAVVGHNVCRGGQLTQETIVKKPGWLRWSRGEKPVDSRFEKLKKVRRRTDQMIKQQDTQKERQAEAEKKEAEKKTRHDLSPMMPESYDYANTHS